MHPHLRKPGRHDPNNRAAATVEVDHLADHRGISVEVPSPCGLAQDDDCICPNRLRARLERAAEERRNTKHREGRRRNRRAHEPDGVALTRQRRSRRHVSRDMRERTLSQPQSLEGLRGQIDQPRRPAIDARGGRRRTEHSHQAIGLRIRQWPQEHTIDDAEDCGGRTDAERQSQESDRRESGSAREHPGGMPQIALQVVEPRERAGLTVQILHLSHAAERTARGEPRLVRGQTPASMLVFEQRKMSGDLARKVAVGRLRPECIDQSKYELAHRLHS